MVRVGNLNKLIMKLRVFDPSRLLVVRVGNLNKYKSNNVRVENPSFYLLNMGCLVKTCLAKTLLREKRPGEENEYTQDYKYWSNYSINSAKVEFKVRYIPSVGNLFLR